MFHATVTYCLLTFPLCYQAFWHIPEGYSELKGTYAKSYIIESTPIKLGLSVWKHFHPEFLYSSSHHEKPGVSVSRQEKSKGENVLGTSL